MSAFVVSKTHIDALVTAGLHLSRDTLGWMAGEPQPEDFQEGQPWGDLDAIASRRRTLTLETAEQTGQMLWAENVRSVNHRYAEEDWEEVYQFERLGLNVDPVVVLDALSCYEYQSCEHPEWHKSEAKAFCEALRDAAIRRLPRKGERSWEITDPQVFGAKVRSLI